MVYGGGGADVSILKDAFAFRGTVFPTLVDDEGQTFDLLIHKRSQISSLYTSTKFGNYEELGSQG